MSQENVQIISEDTAREQGFSQEQINVAKGKEDGYIAELAGVKYYLNIQYNDLRTGARTVEMSDIVGEGKNRLKPGGLRFNGRD